MIKRDLIFVYGSNDQKSSTGKRVPESGLGDKLMLTLLACCASEWYTVKQGTSYNSRAKLVVIMGKDQRQTKQQ